MGIATERSIALGLASKGREGYASFSINMDDRGFGLPVVAVFVLDVIRPGQVHRDDDDFPATKTSLYPGFSDKDDPRHHDAHLDRPPVIRFPVSKPC